MTRTESLYFDLLRPIAAIFVLFGHVVEMMPGALPVHDHGHAAVVAFFVLSGYVIAFVADTKERTAFDYVVSRATRLYSVAVPALILTVTCDFIGRSLGNGSICQIIHADYPLIRIGSALFFTSELWFFSIQPLSNGPYWSLCYEVWYYAIFGALFYFKGRCRAVGIVVLCLIAGPKILAMLPVWALGVLLYRYRRNVGPHRGSILLVISLLGLASFIDSPLSGKIDRVTAELVGDRGRILLEYSKYFASDYCEGLLFGVGFVGIRGLDCHISVPPWAEMIIRWWSGSTFSIYLFHYPLMVLTISVFSPPNTILPAICVALLALSGSIVLSYLTERRKRPWRRAIEYCLSRIFPRTIYPMPAGAVRAAASAD